MLAKITAFIATLCLLTACGVRVEIATPIAPSPTPRPWPSLDNWDGSGVWREQATPRLIFNDAADVEVELFMKPDQADIYLLQYRMLWLVLNYDATWFSAPQSNAQIRLSVYVRHSADEAWQTYDSAENTVTTATVPATTQNTVAVGIYVEELVHFQVRAEVSAVVYLESGDLITRVSANEINVFVLSDPAEISSDVAALHPVWGDLDPEMLLLDWRGWWWGPCVLLDWAVEDASSETLLDACDKTESGDYWTALSLMQDAAQIATNDEIRAALHSMIGLGYANFASFDEAGAYLSTAIDLYAALDHVWEMTVCLHNLLIVYYMQQAEAQAFSTLYKLQELRVQFWDEAGYRLFQANIAYLSYDQSGLDEANAYFAEWGLPQVEIISQWVDRIDG
ncbi:MAG: hypothetical protein HXY40_00085 [Chloroflexi bacterium]|nr:hypothetical protein [Chloroflexota bacterium]